MFFVRLRMFLCGFSVVLVWVLCVLYVYVRFLYYFICFCMGVVWIFLWFLYSFVYSCRIVLSGRTLAPILFSNVAACFLKCFYMVIYGCCLASVYLSMALYGFVWFFVWLFIWPFVVSACFVYGLSLASYVFLCGFVWFSNGSASHGGSQCCNATTLLFVV